MSPELGSPHVRVAALVTGAIFYAAFWGLTQTHPGLDITYQPPFSSSSSGELYFWLGSVCLLFPAACLLGYGLSPWLTPVLRRSWRAVGRLEPQTIWLAAAGIALLGTLLFRTMHGLFLLDFPLTDDEYGVRFGGQAMAGGMLRVPSRGLEPYISSLALYVNDGLISSFDWPGPQAAWAIGEKLGMGGGWVYALFAALPLAIVPLWISRRFGPAWGAAALLFWLFSPMSFALSMTTHAHVLSRAFLAIGLWLFWEASERPGMRIWAACGAALGLGFLCRPFETAFLILPLVGDILLRCTLRKRSPDALFGLFAGVIGPLLFFGWYNYSISGNPLLPARFMPGSWGEQWELAALSKPWDAWLIWNRFGANASYNLFMLCVWFLGPLGVVLVAFGVTADRFCRLLGLSVASALALALLHDDHGIHAVGPIHYSECAVPLTFIAVAGLKRIVEQLRTLGVSYRPLACCAVSALVVGLGSFNAWNNVSLRRQALIQHDVYEFLESSDIGRSVVFADQFGLTWSRVPKYRRVGTWVFEWRPPRPDFSDEVLIFHDISGARLAAESAFPKRELYRLSAHRSAPFLRLTRVDPSEGGPGLVPGTAN